MKIVVLSDTHMPRMAKGLPARLTAELRDADAIVHAGDWTRLSVYDELSAYAPTYGVAGNNDGPELAKKFGLKRLLTFEGCKIGVVHGHGPGGRIDTETRAVQAFQGKNLHALVYGHSHVPVSRMRGGMLVFNPGSPTDKRRQASYSFGLFRISGGSLHAEHVYYGDKSPDSLV